MDNNDEGEYLKLLKFGKFFGWFMLGTGLLGLYVLISTSQTLFHIVLTSIGTAMAFYLTWLCLFGANQQISKIEKINSQRKKRKADWLSKSEGTKYNNLGENK